MESLFMSFRPLLFMTLLLFYACQPLAQESLFVGLPRSASEEVMSLVDGTGEEARFEAIRQLETDSKGNLYVYDVGKEEATRSNDDIYTHSSIRRITSEGLVTTLIGQGVGQDLIGFANRGFAIRNDILYTASAGCLLKADLNQPVIAFEAFYGQCLSATDLARLIQQAKEQGFQTPIEDSFWDVSFQSIQPNQEIYFIAREVPNAQNIDFKITKQESVVNVSKPGRYFVPQYVSDSGYVADRNGFVYGVSIGEPGPGPAGPTYVRKTKFTEPFADMPESSLIYELTNTLQGVLATDQKDNVYVWDYKTLKRIKTNGQIENLAQRTSNRNEFIKLGVIDAQNRFYYYALDTAIYRIALPKAKEQHE
jgi:hypothetical protein